MRSTSPPVVQSLHRTASMVTARARAISFPFPYLKEKEDGAQCLCSKVGATEAEGNTRFTSVFPISPADLEHLMIHCVAGT